MKDDIKITIYSNPTTANPESYRMKVQYKDKHNNNKIETTRPRWQNEKEANRQKTLWGIDYAESKGHFIKPTEPEPDKPMTFREFAALYEKKATDRLLSNSFKDEIKFLTDYFKDKIFSELKRKDVEAFCEWLNVQKIEKIEKRVSFYRNKWSISKKKVLENYSWSSRNHFVNRLSAMNSYAFLNEVDDTNRINFSGFVKPSLEEPRDVTVSFSELEVLLDNCYKPNLRLELVALFECGFRLKECKAVRREDFDNENCLSVGRVLNSKKHKDARITKRPVYFSERIREEIYRYHKTDEQGFLRLADDKSIFDTGKLRKAYERLRERVAIKYAEQGDVKTANKILNLQERDFRTTHRTNLKNAKIEKTFRDVQTAHNQDDITTKFYEHSEYGAIKKEFEKYEIYSTDERLKLQKAMTATG